MRNELVEVIGMPGEARVVGMVVGATALCEGTIVLVRKPVVMTVVGPSVIVRVFPSRKGTMTVL